ncbi:MAG: hypothetical protein H0U65_03390 [Rubrobacter sp.]|nr:hypothetical protein [Rubrobacter sp.]
MESAHSPAGIGASGFVWVAGMLCVIGGVGWAANSLWAAVAGAPEGGAFVIAEVVWVAIQTLLLIGVVGLALSGAAPGWFGVIALGVALLGRVDFLVAEMHSLAIGEESFLLPIGAVITAVGMTLVGISVLRARRWSGWRRYMPLVVGVYPFVAMFPLIAVMSEPSFLSIALWGIPWTLLGLAMWSSRGAG